MSNVRFGKGKLWIRKSKPLKWYQKLWTYGLYAKYVMWRAGIK